jgi:hypothetical protein
MHCASDGQCVSLLVRSSAGDAVTASNRASVGISGTTTSTGPSLEDLSTWPDATAVQQEGPAMTATVDELPSIIPFSKIGKVEDFINANGINARDCISVTFGVHSVTVERIVRTRVDSTALAGHNATIRTVIIGYDRDAHVE